MINHLLRFADEVEAHAALPAYVQPGRDGAPTWRLDVVVPGQRIVLQRAVYEFDAEAMRAHEVSPEVSAPGYYVTVSLPAMSLDFLELPDNACRLIGNPETGVVMYLAPDVDPAVFAAAIVEPMPAGARYTFGNP